MRRRFGRQDIGTLAHQIRGKADRQGAGQREIGQTHGRGAPLGRRVARQCREQILALVQFLLELRNRGLKGGELALQAEYVGIGHGSRFRLDLGDFNLLPLQRNQLLRGLDLRTIRGSGHHRVDDVGGECQIGRAFVGMRHIDLGTQTLDQPTLPAEDVEGVTDRSRQREQVEHVRRRPLSEIQGREPLPRRRRIRLDGRIENPITAAQVILARAQIGLRGGKTGIVVERLLDHPVELSRLKQCPPIGGHRGAGIELLCSALRRCGRGGVLTMRIMCHRRRRRTMKIGSHRAAAKQAKQDGRATQPCRNRPRW